MTRQEAANHIIDAMMAFGARPHQRIALDAVTSRLIDEGLELDDIELSLISAAHFRFIEAEELYISLTELGSSISNAANDNTGIRIIPG